MFSKISSLFSFSEETRIKINISFNNFEHKVLDYAKVFFPCYADQLTNWQATNRALQLRNLRDRFLTPLYNNDSIGAFFSDTNAGKFWTNDLANHLQALERGDATAFANHGEIINQIFRIRDIANKALQLHDQSKVSNDLVIISVQPNINRYTLFNPFENNIHTQTRNLIYNLLDNYTDFETTQNNMKILEARVPICQIYSHYTKIISNVGPHFFTHFCDNTLNDAAIPQKAAAPLRAALNYAKDILNTPNTNFLELEKPEHIRLLESDDAKTFWKELEEAVRIPRGRDGQRLREPEFTIQELTLRRISPVKSARK